MAFGQAWVETDPVGSTTQVLAMDDANRSYKIAVRERLEGDPAVPDLTGLIDVGSFPAAPKPRKGTARAYFDTEANIQAFSSQLEDGRIAITPGSHAYSCAAAGITGLVSRTWLVMTNTTYGVGTTYASPYRMNITGTETAVKMPVGFDGRIRSLFMRLRLGTVGAAGTHVFTLRVNGVSTTLVATFNANDPLGTVAFDTTHAVAVSAGDYIAIRSDNNSGAGGNLFNGGFIYEH